MSNTNSFSGIVKILETPRSYSFKQKARLTKVRVELPQKRKNKKNAIVCLLIWGNLGRQVQKFYTTNDYDRNFIELNSSESFYFSIINSIKNNF